MSDLTPLITRQPAPELSLPLAGGGSWSLQNCRPENFVLLVFYRGYHCPLCRSQLRDLQSRLYDFSSRGVEAVAISTDDESRANASRKEWGLDRLNIAYGLSLRGARDWGLYISTHLGRTSLGVEEPLRFSEPGLFLVQPDGDLYYAAVQSSPFARPSLSELVNAIDFVVKNSYPARGDVEHV